MGWILTHRAYLLGGTVPRPPHQVLLRLAHSAKDEDGRGAYPSVRRMTRELQMDRSTVFRSLAWLKHEQHGFIEREIQGGGRGNLTWYRVVVDKLPPLDEKAPWSPSTAALPFPLDAGKGRVVRLNPKGSRGATERVASGDLKGRVVRLKGSRGATHRDSGETLGETHEIARVMERFAEQHYEGATDAALLGILHEVYPSARAHEVFRGLMRRPPGVSRG